MSKEKKQLTSSCERVALFRKHKNLSQQELADIVGVSRGYIGDIERSRSEPSANFLTLLTSKLNVSIDWLLTGDGEMYRLKNDETRGETNKTRGETNETHTNKVIALYESLSDNQRKEILSVIEEKKRLNQLIETVENLQAKVG